MKINSGSFCSVDLTVDILPPPSVMCGIMCYAAVCRRETSSSRVSEAEFEEILQRNKTMSSSAISRAVQDASSGTVSTLHALWDTYFHLVEQPPKTIKTLIISPLTLTAAIWVQL